jgi:hypothetical protein
MNLSRRSAEFWRLHKVERTEPKRLTRAGLFAEQARIAETYGPSVLGTKLHLLYLHSQGMKNREMFADLVAAADADLSGMQPVDGRPCSRKYYARKALTYHDRLDRERRARWARGEEFSVNLKRNQAC